MNVHLEKDECGCCPEGTTILTMHCEREDAAMVYFALREYSDKLVKSLKKAKEVDWEDKMFLHESLYKINISCSRSSTITRRRRHLKSVNGWM